MLDEVIWKYPLPLVAGDSFEVEMPAYGKILSVQFQDRGFDAGHGMMVGQAQMWVLVNKTHNKVKREFVVLATGQDFDSKNLKYAGTWQDGSYVWHLFEVLR